MAPKLQIMSISGQVVTFNSDLWPENSIFTHTCIWILYRFWHDGTDEFCMNEWMDVWTDNLKNDNISGPQVGRDIKTDHAFWCQVHNKGFLKGAEKKRYMHIPLVQTVIS